MNPSRKASSLLLATGLALTALTALGQSSASTSSSQEYAPLPPPVPNAPLSSNSTKGSESGSTRDFTVEQFMAVDTDYDGRISLKEFVDSPILSGKADASTRSSASGTPRSDETTNAGTEVSGRNTPDLFHRLDKNENGYLSSTEIAAYYRLDSKL